MDSVSPCVVLLEILCVLQISTNNKGNNGTMFFKIERGPVWLWFHRRLGNHNVRLRVGKQCLFMMDTLSAVSRGLI